MSSLKAGNRYQLACLLGAPLVVVLFVQVGWAAFESILAIPVIAGLSTIIASILVMLADSIPQNVKHKLVFLRLRHELPGHRCDKLCSLEPRLSGDNLAALWPDIFGASVDAAARNGLWYKHIYKPVRDTPEVESAHRNFLLYRDTTAGYSSTLIVLSAWYLSGLHAPYFGDMTLLGVFIEFAFFVIALASARNHGNRMVVNATVARANQQRNRG